MIAVIELLHFSFSHECFNAGTVLQIASAYPDQSIVYCAEEKQVECVRKLLPNAKNVLYHKVMDLSDRNQNSKKVYEIKYNDILAKIVEKYSPTTVVFTSSHCVQGIDVISLVKKRKDIKFLFFQHGELEQLLKQKPIQVYRLYREAFYYKLVYIYLSILDYFRQIALLKRRKEEQARYKAYIEELSKCSNANIIVFSKEYEKYRGVIPANILRKFKKIYLPYVYDWNLDHRSFDGEVKIGILPTSAEDPDAIVWKIVDYVNKHLKECLRPFRFCIYREENRGIKNVYTYESKGYDREYLNEFMDYCDWLLVPYSKLKYRLSSSGSLFDCINRELPIMMYASPCFNDFSEKIGMRRFSVKEMGKAIIQIINNYSESDRQKYILEMKRLKERMNQSNVNFFQREIEV